MVGTRVYGVVVWGKEGGCLKGLTISSIPMLVLLQPSDLLLVRLIESCYTVALVLHSLLDSNYMHSVRTSRASFAWGKRGIVLGQGRSGSHKCLTAQ